MCNRSEFIINITRIMFNDDENAEKKRERLVTRYPDVHLKVATVDFTHQRSNQYHIIS